MEREMESLLDGRNGVIVWLLIGVLLFIVASIVVKEFIGAIMLGIFLYYCSRPIYRKFTNFIPYDSINAILTLITFIAPFLIITYYTFLTAVSELQKVILQYELYELQPYLNSYVNFDLIRIFETPEALISEAEGLNLITGIIDYIILVSGMVGDALILGLIALTVAFYLLTDDDKLRNWIDTQFSVFTEDFTDFATIIDQELSNIYFGNILNAIITAIIATTVFYIYNIIAPESLLITFPVLFGLLAGIASLVPMIGVKPVYFPITIFLTTVVYFTNTLPPTAYIYPLGLFITTAIIVDFIPEVIIRPHVSGRNIHIGLLLIAYIAGPVIFGWYGFFFLPFLTVIFQQYYTLIFPKLIRSL